MSSCALVVLFVFIFHSYTAINITSFLLVEKTPARRTPAVMVYGISALPNLPNRGIETEIFVAQAVCHAPGVRFDESKVLSERKNFELVRS